MKQRPPVGKTRRAALRTLAATGGGGILLRSGALIDSEAAALRLRRAARGAPALQGGTVRFLLPLVAPWQVPDWAEVEQRLHATLRSFLAQSDGRWQAVICGQVRPTLPDDPRIRFLPFTEEIDGNDKWPKQGALCRDLPVSGMGAGYVMPFDADDLLHRDAVAEMLQRRAPGGYLCVRGYVNDLAAVQVGVTGPQTLRHPLRKPFWKLCGSCAALRYHPDLPESAVFLEEMTRHEHRMFPYLAALAGLPLVPFDVPAAMYMLNHGSNFTARLAQTGSRSRFAERFALTDPRERAGLAERFALDAGLSGAPAPHPESGRSDR